MLKLVFLLLAALLALAVAVPAPVPGPNPAPSPQFFYSAGYPAVGYASPYVYYG
ncbi:neuropeptide-like 4 [Drosophila sulfurigaster albostrigata]|uniref:Neuropeptide-like 4 n=1 Tax=Drosophila albomicans TaxID=7291 RepID=A0A6P8WNA7_DROAB|nr:neuropeptide-like 4 [Drosophila albomicans]XP_051858719.1 neuropeptide-like 4 [Drosophila albomicans]XP_062122243.1 neuropeptide-like 4 [Drosophila sulfurigaster albostrigata]XP_062122253.1 neuropeptide-like 4 [Drosophila sulfurigaster albostrigata]